MPKTRLEKKRRVDQAAASALETEVRLNESRLAAAIPDSSLFDRDSDLPRRKPKVSLPPRRSNVPDLQPASVEYFDLWGEPPPEHLPKRITQPKSKPPPPKSSDAYRSLTHVVPRRAPSPIPVIDPSIPTIHEIDSGMGDTLAGDVLDLPHIDVALPGPPPKKQNDIQINMHIPRWLPEEQKKKKVAEVKANRRRWKELDDEKKEAEVAITQEEADDVMAAVEAEKQRPKQAKEDPIMRFIADEPAYEVEEMPGKLSDAPADARPFARLQRSLESRRKTMLHE
jgi:hypothetical protein